MPRVPLSRRLIRLQQRDQIVEHRLAGQPFSVIAKALKIPERRAHRVFAEYFRKAEAHSTATQHIRKSERRGQLEYLDAIVMRLVVDSSTGPARAAGGYSVRDFLAAVETSRRCKNDLTKLDGLEGSPVSTAGAGTQSEVPGLDADERKALIAREFIDSFRDVYPELHDHFLRVFGAEELPPAETTDAAADQPERDPGGSGSAESRDPAADPPADSGLDDA